MLSYISRRVIGSIIVLWGISLVSFFLVFAIPGDPATAIAGPHATNAVLEAVRAKYGLNLPIPLQYLHYMGHLLHGDLGDSYVYGLPVTQMIGQRMLPTLELALGGFIAELIIGIPLGIFTARRARKVSDYLISALALVCISMPVYWLGAVLRDFFGFRLGIFPISGSGDFLHLVLPSLAIGITGAAAYLRLLKSSMLEVLNRDYVRTARAKGAGNERVIWLHVLRNAVIPVVTFAGVDIGYLLSGVVLVEVTFNWNGLGMLGYGAIPQLDVPVIMGTVMFTAVLVVLFNLIVDILYGVIDPRIRFE